MAVADFRALEKARAADDAIGDARNDEALSSNARICQLARTSTAQLSYRRPAWRQLVTSSAISLASCSPSHTTAHLHQVAIVGRGAQRLAEARAVGGDEVRGRREDVRSGAVVLLQAGSLSRPGSRASKRRMLSTSAPRQP